MAESGAVITPETIAKCEEVAQNPQWWDEEDLEAQRHMAAWTRRIGYFTAVGLFVLFWTLWETRKVTVETRRIGEKQVQAYLIANTGEFRVIRHFRDEGVGCDYSINFNLLVSNKGQSPGRKVDIDFEVWGLKEKAPGRAISFLNFEGNTFCADVGPGAQETAILSSDPYRDVEFREFMENFIWLDVRGNMVWVNEFGNRQEQPISLATPKFFFTDVFMGEDGFNDKARLPLVSIGRRLIAQIPKSQWRD